MGGYIYIYTSAYPCIQCTEYVRLCVECNRHPWSCPAKRLRVSLACLVRFVFVRLCPVERPSDVERARAANSSAPARPSGLGNQQASAAPPCEASPGRLGLSGSVRFRSALPGRGRSEAERARAANSNAPARPSLTEQSGAEQKLMPITDEQKTALFERKKRTHLTAVGSSGTFRACCGYGASSSDTFRAFCGSGASSSGTFRAFCGSGASSSSTSRAFCSSGPGLSSTSRAFCGSGACSSGHFEPAAAPGQARAAISRQLRLRGRF